MDKQNDTEINNQRREFLRKSALAAYTTPALLSMVVSTDAAAYKSYGQCVKETRDREYCDSIFKNNRESALRIFTKKSG